MSPKYMYYHCKKSCQLCDSPPPNPEVKENCLDQHEKCPYWADNGKCGKNPKYMYTTCKKSCKVCDTPLPNPEVIEPCIDENTQCAT
ncbi:putative tyrosinase-like protein tyr-3 [Octopus sinensis]|uniref:Tyrosinase-like protein tyr-3 n=1 Tax=Octopus sinensis TaxID=2607531 RepID=A0A6P7TJ71_9MOLL|nr:putative tyrosinase-like protein tyr-3 [Octopus sinensis]